MRKTYNITIQNIDFKPEVTRFSELDNSLECPVILVANINNWGFDDNLMFQKLNTKEKKQANKFKVEKPQKTYMLAHFLIHYFLHKFHFLPNELSDYQTGKFGKPYFENNPGLYFNISHAQNRVALAYFKYEIGADIEHIKADKEQINLVSQHCFTQAENEQISNNNNLFYKFWTKKESVLKAIGCGITDELTKIETAHHSQKLSLEEDVFKDFDRKKLFIWSEKLNDYYLSICSPKAFSKIKLVEISENDIKHANKA